MNILRLIFLFIILLILVSCTSKLNDPDLIEEDIENYKLAKK